MRTFTLTVGGAKPKPKLKSEWSRRTITVTYDPEKERREKFCRQFNRRMRGEPMDPDSPSTASWGDERVSTTA